VFDDEQARMPDGSELQTEGAATGGKSCADHHFVCVGHKYSINA